MRKTHPCNTLGFVFIEPTEYQKAMTQQLRLRDEELKKDRSFSGEPPLFVEWALDHVRQLAASDPSVAKQLKERIASLDSQLGQLDEEHLRQVQAYKRREKQLTDQVQQLIALLPLP